MPSPARYKRALPGVLALALSFFLIHSAVAAVEVTAIEMNVSKLQRSVAFYRDVLQFRVVETTEATARLQLGNEILILNQPDSPGQPIPPDLPANDISFQHIAIVVSDIDEAAAHLLRDRTRFVSSEVQRLPDWNFDAAGIRALYFRDPDNHFLELIQFPANKGEPRWQQNSGKLFHGIDHTALVVSDLKRSVAFYRDQLGFTISGDSFNHGIEQERLNGVAGSRVRITSLRGANGPGIELLKYETPGTSRVLAKEVSPNDLSAWRIAVESTRDPATELADPDQHRLLVRQVPFLQTQLGHARAAFRQHWPRYLMEGAELGIFMIVALGLALLLEHPQSRWHRAIPSPLVRRFIFGLGIGVTVLLLIYSTWGRQSGAHFNPSVTLAMLYLHRIQPWDAFFYILAQFLGGWLGVMLMAAPFPKASAYKKVKFVVTEPGKPGIAVAFLAEFVISFVLLLTLRLAYHSDLLKPWVGYFAGFLLMLYIAFESPLSGMSLNPARSVASAIPARSWKAMWIYFTAPPLAMWLAVLLTD